MRGKERPTFPPTSFVRQERLLKIISILLLPLCDFKKLVHRLSLRYPTILLPYCSTYDPTNRLQCMSTTPMMEASFCLE